MSIETKIILTTELGATDLANQLQSASGDPNSLGNGLVNFISGAMLGTRTSKVNVQVNRGSGTSAAGTVTFASALAADTITVLGVALIAGTDFSIAGTNTADAAAYAAAVNAHATLGKVLTATSAAAVATLTVKEKGVLGNFAPLASSDGGRLAVSGALLSGGAESATNEFSFGL